MLSCIPIVDGSQFDPIISIHYNLSLESTPLNYLNNFQPHETLGVCKSTTGADITGSKKLETKNAIHEQTIINSPFDDINT